MTQQTPKGKMDFCTMCRQNTGYTLKKQSINKIIKGVEYSFKITVAVCNECGGEMGVPGLIDRNIREIDEQYRAYEGIVSIADIDRIMKIYKIGKAPLSLALGFGEITITRYLAGQIPSKEYSDILRRALSSPSYMKEKLWQNKDKIAQTAYHKAMEAAVRLDDLFSVSDTMLQIISYIFERLEEVTPLMLQKLLYFVQGVSCALYKEPLLSEDCQAWVHGPVYPQVYDMFRDFKFNPIEDARFAILEGMEDALDEKKRRVVDLVVDTFGEYGGKRLEKITHEEKPWKIARKGYSDGIRSNEIILKENIAAYYIKINQKYDFSQKEGIQRYINDALRLHV